MMDVSNAVSPEGPRGSRRRLRVVVAAVIALALAVAATFIVRPWREGRVVTANHGFPEPESATATSTIAYLKGEGRVLRVMHEHAAAVLDSAETVDQCRQEAKALDDAAPADEVLGLIGGVTDPVLRTGLHAERTSLGVVLTACISGEAHGGKRSSNLERGVEAVDIRLGELAAAA